MTVLYTLGMKSTGSGVADFSMLGPSSGWRVMISQQINHSRFTSDANCEKQKGAFDATPSPLHHWTTMCFRS